MLADTRAERLLCDTSFVGHLRAQRARPERYQHWDHSTLTRIDNAILAISVVTLAEARFGYLKAEWGQAKISEEESRLASFVQVPLDFPDLDEWARLRVYAKNEGVVLADNDLWIAATASTREFPLVTCDLDQQRIEGGMATEVIYLPPP
jgi:predicted nucleic acid-binding protein